MFKDALFIIFKEFQWVVSSIMLEEILNPELS
jgi:hypothetical protein